MEKIKASEILAMNESLTIEELKGFRFFAVDRNGNRCIYEKEPLLGLKIWDNYWKEGDDAELVFVLCNNDDWKGNWQDSLREIDFDNEPEPSQAIETFIKQTTDWLMKNSGLDVELIVDLSDYLRKINNQDETPEIEIKGVKFALTIEEIEILRRKLTTILCNNEKHVQSVKDYLREFEESDRQFPDELFTPRSQMKDEESL